MRRSRLVAGAAVTAVAAGLLTTSMMGGTDAAAPVSSEAFDHPRPNAYYPLVPGTVSRLRGTEDGERLRETVTVTHRHKTIQGVRTTVVRDVLRREDGTLAERTHDWYAADNRGNVWYFGEATATYDARGRLESREGSWQAGVAGGRRGIVMPASPRPTDAFRQEYDAGNAEDQAWIVQRGFTVKVPYGTRHHALRSFEWTRLEPVVLSEKVYAPGLGIVRERDVAGGNETFALVSVTPPR
jgi:hypothetical protein